jgi:hypothetical protein
MATTSKSKPPTKKVIATAKALAKSLKRTAEIETAKADLSPQNRQRYEKVMADKNKPKSAAVALPKVALSAEREQQLAEWHQRQAADDAVLRGWGRRLATTRKNITKLDEQYRDIRFKFIQEAYAVFKEAVKHDLADVFFGAVRGQLLKEGIKIQSNTPDAALIVRLVFGADASTKSVSEYAKVMQAAIARDIRVDTFSEWLKKETLTKVLADQRAVEAETETPKDRLERARRLILRLLDIRETKPIIKHSTTAHAAEGMLGRHYGLCVAIGHASRRVDRSSFYADVNLSMVLPVSLDFEIYIVDKLARYIIRDVEEHESKINSLEESVWADQLYERLVAAGDEEIDANNEYWSNRQQAALAEDQQEFIKAIKNKKSKSIIS